MPDEAPVTMTDSRGARVRAWLRGRIVRPFAPPEPLNMGYVAWCMTLTALAAAAGALLFAAGSGTLDWWMLAVLVPCALLGEVLLIEVRPGHFVGCGDLFFFAGFCALDLRGGVAMIAAVGLLKLALRLEYWIQIFGWVGVTSLCYLGGLLAAQAVVQNTDWGWGATATVGVFAAWTGTRLTEVLVAVPLDWCWSEATATSTRWQNTVAQIGQMVRDVGRIAPNELPAAIMAALVIIQWPAAAALVIVPFAVSWQLTRQRAQLAAAQRRALVDPLTGLFNRAGLYEHTLEWRAEPDGQVVTAVLLGDLDNFKRVNDTHGHAVGDDVLTATASLLQRYSDGGDVVCRYGGEEFVVAVQRPSRADVRLLAEGLRVAVEHRLHEFDSSISIGIAYQEGAESLDEMLLLADRALYAAKYAGKNRVVVAGTPEADLSAVVYRKLA